MKNPEINKIIIEELKKHPNKPFESLCQVVTQGISKDIMRNKRKKLKVVRLKLKARHLKYKAFIAIKKLKRNGVLEENNSKYNLSIASRSLLYSSSNASKLQDKDIEQLMTWTYDIGDKQYRSYSWNDSKVQCLLTVDAALIAGILFVLQFVNDKSTFDIEGFPIALYGLAFLFLAISLISCLIHSIPKLNSKIGNDENLRTIIGINRYTNLEMVIGKDLGFVAKDKYYESVTKLKPIDMLRMNCGQIAGMAKNNRTSHKIIRRGVQFTICSVIALLLGTAILMLQTMLNTNLWYDIINQLF